MPLTISSSPTYPVAAKGARLSFTPGGAGNFVRVWCTAAPTGSKLKSRLDAEASARIQIHEGDIATGGGVPFDFQADLPGKYTVVAQEYTRGASTYGGGYAGDPRGFSTETKVGSEVSASIDFGQRVTIKLGTGPDTATLVFWVWDHTIRATSVALQGELSPNITQPSSPTANTAALSSGVVAAVAALVDGLDTTVAGTGADLDATINNIITKLNAHFANGTAHAAADADNTIPTAFKSPTTKTANLKSLSKLVERYTAHILNDPRDGSGQGGAGYHVVSTVNVSDGANTLHAPVPNDQASVYAMLGNIYYAYEAHRVSTAVHASADSTNVLSAIPPLMQLEGLFLRALQSVNPTAAATENPGATLFANIVGAKLS